jgi:hypothetical protein
MVAEFRAGLGDRGFHIVEFQKSGVLGELRFQKIDGAKL